MDQPQQSGALDERAYRPFRPIKARRVAWALAIVGLVVLTVIGLIIEDAPMLVRLAFIATGLAVAWFMSLQARVRAVPSESGLVVRNLFLGRTLEWAEIIAVRFGADRAWVQLDLADGDTLAVMAIQRADGDYAEKEARRLATLVEYGSRTADPA
jgi:uncharacterized membrane protein YuzA (DUF378 family)